MISDYTSNIMTKLLVYSKNADDPEIPEFIDWNPSQRKEIIDKISQQGIICLTNETIFRFLNKDIKRIGYFDCGEKK